MCDFRIFQFSRKSVQKSSSYIQGLNPPPCPEPPPRPPPRVLPCARVHHRRRRRIFPVATSSLPRGEPISATRRTSRSREHRPFPPLGPLFILEASSIARVHSWSTCRSQFSVDPANPIREEPLCELSIVYQQYVRDCFQCPLRDWP